MLSALLQIIDMILGIAWFIVIIHVVLSWLINFNVLNLGQPLVAQIWDGLNRLLDPIYSRIRAILPDTGALDLSPLVLLVGLYAARIMVANALFNTI